MATAKIVTWSRPDKDGNYPIGIKIWNNGKPSYIFEGHTLPSRDLWDAKNQEVKKAYPNAARLTVLLTNRLAEVRNTALELSTDAPKVSAQEIKQEVQGTNEEPQEAPKLLFIDIANQYLADHKSLGNYDQEKAERSRIKRFCTFTKGGKIPFDNITGELLLRYKVYLKASKNRNFKDPSKKKPLAERTITNHLLIIRTLYNRAILCKAASRDNYPFGEDGQIKIKFGKTTKIGLEEAEITKLAELDLTGKSNILQHARNIWLLSFYFAGMRITDTLTLKWTDFQNVRLFYEMSKNDEPLSFVAHPKALAILGEYKDQQNNFGYVFPLLNKLHDENNKYDLRRKISNATNALNRAMKILTEMIGSTKNASQHKSRHAFAQRAEDKGIHPKVLQKMYRHTSILTTMIYQSNFSHNKMDEALGTVLGL